MNVLKKRSIYIRIFLSIISLMIGVALYWLFDNGILHKNNLIFTIIRNYLSDVLWCISFFFLAIIFSKNITRYYILFNSVIVFIIGVVFELMQLHNIANGTFDFIDILVYFFAILIASFLEKYMEVKIEKT